MVDIEESLFEEVILLVEYLNVLVVKFEECFLVVFVEVLVYIMKGD